MERGTSELGRKNVLAGEFDARFDLFKTSVVFTLAAPTSGFPLRGRERPSLIYL